MIRGESETFVRRPVELVFDFVASRFFDNYPRWSPEVVELTQTSPGPVRVGTTGRQARIDKGVRTESHFRVAELVPPARLVFQGLSDPYRVLYAFEPVDGATRLHFRFELIRIPLVARPFERVVRSAVQDKAREVVIGIRELVETEVPLAAG
ncbi:MAG: SRPBCC family protein [Chromatiales bacterium]|jgi:hypothetical protein